MEFSVVEIGYDQDQVDACLEDLAEQLGHLAAQAEAAAETSAELSLVREEVGRLRTVLSGKPTVYRISARMQQLLAMAEDEAAEIRAQAREELTAAQAEARQVRERAYAEALQARRDFEAALHARRQREEWVDEILRGVTVVRMQVDSADSGTGASATAVPATRTESASEAESEPSRPRERGRPAASA